MNCRPTRLGKKHLDLIMRQLGEPRCRAFIESYNALGKWYLIGSPEHFDKCHYCGCVAIDNDLPLTMAPLRCAGCDRIGWVYWPELDAYRNPGDYPLIPGMSAERMMGELGYPGAMF